MKHIVLEYLRLEDGRRWIDAATPQQVGDVEEALARDSTTPYHWWGRARGGSKTSDGGIGAIELLLHAPPGSRSYAFGADRDQAALLIDVLAGVIRRGGQPLADVFDVQAWKVVVRATGASLEALAADDSGAWGLRPYFVFVDEIAQWPTSRSARRLWEAISTSLPRRAGGWSSQQRPAIPPTGARASASTPSRIRSGGSQRRTGRRPGCRSTSWRSSDGGSPTRPSADCSRTNGFRVKTASSPRRTSPPASPSTAHKSRRPAAATSSASTSA